MPAGSGILGHSFQVNTNPIRVENLEADVETLTGVLEDMLVVFTNIVAKEQIRQISFIQQQELMTMQLKLTDLATLITELEDEVYK